MPLAPGTLLGPYEILAPIGAGGMGEVYKARDTRLDRIVAIKISKTEFSERFEREARAIAALNHPHICQLYDVGPNYLVMEFIEGAPLKGPLPMEKAVEYAGADSGSSGRRAPQGHHASRPEACQYPGHQTRNQAARFRLGQADRCRSGNRRHLTRPHAARGRFSARCNTCRRSSCRARKPTRAAICSAFGCVLYEMLTGKRAFEGESAASVIAAILEREPAPLDGSAAAGADRPALAGERPRSAVSNRPRSEGRARLGDGAAASVNRGQAGPPVVDRRGRSGRSALSSAAGPSSRFRQPPADDRVVRLQINPPEGSRFTFGNIIGGIALSPDGRTAAFVASGNGKTGLWVRPLDGTTARLIAGTEGAAYSLLVAGWQIHRFFRGRQVAASRSGGRSAVGDLRRDLSPRRGVEPRRPASCLERSAAGLFQVPASGGTPSPLTTLDASRGEGFPSLAAGASRRPLLVLGPRRQAREHRHLCRLLRQARGTGAADAHGHQRFVRARRRRQELSAVAAGRDVWSRRSLTHRTLKLAGEPHPVADPVAKIGLLGQMNVAVSDGGMLLYSATNVLSRFTWLDRTGKPLGMVGEPGEYTSIFRLSPDGRRVVASRDRPGGSDLWLTEVERGVSLRLTTSGINYYPVWSPDGRTIVFSSGAPRNLFRKESSGAGKEERLSQSAASQFPSDWSARRALDPILRNRSSTPAGTFGFFP